MLLLETFTFDKDIAIAVLSATATLGAVYLKFLLDKRRKPVLDPVVDSQETDLQVRNKQHEIMDHTGADRAYILEFHNGGKFYSGRSMQKVSMSYEICRPGVTHEQTNYQGILMSSYADFVSVAMANSDNIIINDIDTVADPQMKADMAKKGIVSMYVRLIRSLDDRIIGAMVINYIRRKKNFSGDDVLYIAHSAEVLSGYLL